MSGSGISWAICVCTSLQTDNHASTPPLSFCRLDALPATQPTASKHWRQRYRDQNIPKSITRYHCVMSYTFLVYTFMKNVKIAPWQNKILLHVLRAVLALMTGTGWWLCRHCFCSVESSLAATSAAVSAASATSAAASANRDQLKTACDMPTWEWVPYAECIRGGNFWQAVVFSETTSGADHCFESAVFCTVTLVGHEHDHQHR